MTYCKWRWGGATPTLHEFRIGQKRFGKPDPNDQLMDLPTSGDERKAHLFTVLGKARAKAIYVYGFGDSWEHVIVVEKVLTPEPKVAYPICVAGKRQCPPEDCGGVPGYYNLLEAIRNPAHKEHEEMLDWVGGHYDPEAFSVEDVNHRLAPLQRWRAKTRNRAWMTSVSCSALPTTQACRKLTKACATAFEWPLSSLYVRRSISQAFGIGFH
jgi:hypothetical protein